MLLVVCWISGEILGAIAGAVLAGGETGISYLMAIIGAGVGAAITFLVVANVKAAPAPVGSSSNRVSIGPPTTSMTAATPPTYGGRSDQEAQQLVQMAQACEARHDWLQALNYWRAVAEKAADPQWIQYSQQRYYQLHQWLSQQAALAQRPQ